MKPILPDLGVVRAIMNEHLSSPLTLEQLDTYGVKQRC